MRLVGGNLCGVPFGRLVTLGHVLYILLSVAVILLRLADRLLQEAFCLLFFVARNLANALLNLALRFFQGAFNLIFVHGVVSKKMLQTIATRPKENSLFERFQRQFMLYTVRRKAARTDVCVGQTLADGRVVGPR